MRRGFENRPQISQTELTKRVRISRRNNASTVTFWTSIHFLPFDDVILISSGTLPPLLNSYQYTGGNAYL